MAPVNRIILAGALAAFVAARPLNVPRSPVEVTETAWTTINVPVTLWVDENGTPLSTVAPGGNFATVPTSSPVTTVSTTTAPVAIDTPAASPTTTTPPVYQKQAETTTPPAQAAYSPEPVASSPVPASSPAPVASPNSSRGDADSVSASASNSCEGTGAACSGDITHWDGGLGACGWTVNTASDMQIALPVGLMGDKSNNNPYCGRSLTIKNPTTGQTVQATVGDKCMGCTGRSIDLTNALFASIGAGCDGRCSDFQWWFN